MHFNRHSPHAVAQHAFLSPSNPAWVNYEEDKLDRVFLNHMAARRGTELHALAANLIRLGVKLPDVEKTLNMYVNDGIGFGLTPEQILFYSENCFGTADACGFRNNTLRISDLKTGLTEAAKTQLEVYAALFCLEYNFKPRDIRIELRIYQNDDVREEVADMDRIYHIIDKIVTHDKRIKFLKEEVPF